MSTYDFDILVIGAGHAGCEAALAAARLGAKTALLTMNCDTVGQMSCNPAIGGVAKGQIVREIDALGGEMGKVIDANGLQFRMLNRSKGPAMHSPRAQADKKLYQFDMKRRIEEQPNLTLRQETTEQLLVERLPGEVPCIVGAQVRGGATYRARAVILTTGTFLQAIMHTGEAKTPGGRAGDGTTGTLSDSLRELGFQLERFKTGTPARLNGRTIDYTVMQEQPGDDDPQPFSFMTTKLTQPQLSCWLTETNESVHEVIRANLHRAPMYSGQINSRGPRYCPSIEDKVVRFADKTSHHIFLEPEGYNTREIYCNGISTSLPRDVQDAMIHSVKGLERAEIMRYGYAVEYDYAPPTQLRPSLETKSVAGLYFAGQINGTTGYEEAAGQGLLAGINAALALQGKEPLVLDRSEAYLGVLIDDLVTKGVDEPYRMFTSRAEFRLVLRHDNADLRLTAKGREVGLVDNDRWQAFEEYQRELVAGRQLLHKERHEGATLEEHLRRPDVTWQTLAGLSPVAAAQQISARAAGQLEIETKYAGYIRRQDSDIEKASKLGGVRIPAAFDYHAIQHLRKEAKEKLSRIQPADLGQAGRISGITPADLSIVLLHIKERDRLTSV
ncbi:MAG: tRNA uridine-5-carboxymethylaminomethyl(34) synthesis enzyme MnmG [Planctomyces sp.]|nr:tRNA uridine-5-carboxymethylaminomethyl(34) synthesis enzyme MnmG [Planctomyces sp.]